MFNPAKQESCRSKQKSCHLKSSRGQAVVEFALVFPVFLLLILGIIEFSRIGYSYVTINNAVRSGARVASLGSPDNEIINTVSESAPLFNRDNLTVTITPNQAARTSGSKVTVSASYPLPLLTPVIGQLLPNPFVVSSTLAMRME